MNASAVAIIMCAVSNGHGDTSSVQSSLSRMIGKVAEPGPGGMVDRVSDGGRRRR
jgi:hypothetical protein